MPRIPALILALGFASNIGHAGNSAVTAPNQLVDDFAAMAGFAVTAPCPLASESPEGPTCANRPVTNFPNIYHPEAAGWAPAWGLTQWGFPVGLSPAGSYYNNNSQYDWYGPNARFGIYPDGVYEMAVNGYGQFGGSYANVPSANWPSLYFTQNISGSGSNQHLSGSLASMANLNFSLQVNLAYSVQNIGPGYNASKNAAIFMIYIKLLKMNNPGQNQYVWFGIPAYDDRYAFPGAYVQGDPDTGMLIYTVPYAKFASTSVQSQQWVTLQANILPYAMQSVETGFQSGWLASNDLNDYQVGGIFIGLELTGLNNITMQFYNPSLQTQTFTNGGTVCGSTTATLVQWSCVAGAVPPGNGWALQSNGCYMKDTGISCH